MGADGRSAVRRLCSTGRRIRKVKCDENKPFCNKCVKTGRTCDGYESPFRPYNGRFVNGAAAAHSTSAGIGPQAVQPALAEITPQEIDVLSRCFSTKTVFGVKLGCDEEAKQVLQASLTDPSLRYAVSSLRALREDFEVGGGQAPILQQTPSYNYGIQQYGMALSGLASNLSSPGSGRVKSALLCCQIFTSIEQVRQDYVAVVQHLTRGLRIMHECRARPSLNSADELVPANHEQLPLLDVYIIKLFAAPCKFAEPPAATDPAGAASSSGAVSIGQQPVRPDKSRTITPDVRTELTRIAMSTLAFLDKVSQVESAGEALQLLPEKAVLLESLESWLSDLERLRAENKSPGRELLMVSFFRLFRVILKVVLVGALDSSPDFHDKLRVETEQMQAIAAHISERAKAY